MSRSNVGRGSRPKDMRAREALTMARELKAAGYENPKQLSRGLVRRGMGPNELRAMIENRGRSTRVYGTDSIYLFMRDMPPGSFAKKKRAKRKTSKARFLKRSRSYFLRKRKA